MECGVVKREWIKKSRWKVEGGRWKKRKIQGLGSEVMFVNVNVKVNGVGGMGQD